MDHPALLALAALAAAAFAAALAELARAGTRMGHLHEVAPAPPAELPPVTIVVAARDEAATIEPALRSLLAQEGVRVEVVAVDDRSTDGTGEILDRAAAADPRLRVLHVAELPPGWLGKTHALHRGAAEARGDLVLFTDADVVMRPDTVARAASYLLREGLDHLTAAPRIVMPGILLQAFGVAFGVFFALFAKPWKARDPRSARHVGIGAFNLLRVVAYRRMGGHAPVAMRPDDDMKLGKLVKKHGLSQDFLYGAGQISVEWYATLRQALRGLRKNGFAGVDYRLDRVLLATVAIALLFLVPVPAVLLTGGWTRLLFGVAIGLMLLLYAGAARAQGSPVWHAVLFPVAAVFFLAAIWNATAYALWNGGIEWRGTHYPLDELRANRV